MNELGKIREFIESPKKDVSESMVEQADEINRILDSINLDEDYEDRKINRKSVDRKINRASIYGIDQEAIRKEETNEKLYYSHGQYLDSVKRLALEKMKNDMLFEIKLSEELRRLSSIGYTITREAMLGDILSEIDKQRTDMNLKTPSIGIFTDSIQSQTMGNSESLNGFSNTDDVQSQIEYLKSNLGKLFELSPDQEPKTSVQGSIPGEPAIQSVGDHQEKGTELETPNISQSDNDTKEKLAKAEEETSQIREWASQQPNKPTFVKTGDQTVQSNIWNDLNGLERNSKEFFDRFDTIYGIQVERLAALKAKNSPDFESQLSIATQNILNSTDRMPNAKKQLLSDVGFYLSRPYNKKESQASEREDMIIEIIQMMYPQGVEYVPINDIKKQLESYSDEELKKIKLQYVEKFQEQQGSIHK